MGALGASTDLNSRMAWLQAGLDGPMYDATGREPDPLLAVLGLISLVSLVAAWLVLQIAFDKKKAVKAKKASPGWGKLSPKVTCEGWLCAVTLYG